MTVCKFFLEGRCRFGSACINEHEQPGDSQRNNHRFGTDSNNTLRGRIGFPSSSTDYPSANKIYDERSVRADLTKDRPEYKYSCYGPAKEEPNLLEGTDYSAEELRAQYYNIMNSNGVDTAYRAGVKDLEDRMQGQIDTILRDVRSALGRFDVKRQQLAQQQAQGATGFAFGQPPQPQPQHEPQRQGAYGSPSVLGAPSITPAFGSSINQPNQPSTPSLMGSSYNQPAAATPSLFGSTPSAFGASASTFGGNNNSFGYPAAQAQAQAQPNTGTIFGFQQQPQQPDPQQQQYLLQMQQQQQQQQQQELLAQQQQQQMLQQQMLQQQMQQQQQQPPQPGNTQGTINNLQMQAFASSEFELYKIPEIPPPSEFRR